MTRSEWNSDISLLVYKLSYHKWFPVRWKYMNAFIILYAPSCKVGMVLSSNIQDISPKLISSVWRMETIKKVQENYNSKMDWV